MTEFFAGCRFGLRSFDVLTEAQKKGRVAGYKVRPIRDCLILNNPVYREPNPHSSALIFAYKTGGRTTVPTSGRDND